MPLLTVFASVIFYTVQLKRTCKSYCLSLYFNIRQGQRLSMFCGVNKCYNLKFLALIYVLFQIDTIGLTLNFTVLQCVKLFVACTAFVRHISINQCYCLGPYQRLHLVQMVLNINIVWPRCWHTEQ